MDSPSAHRDPTPRGRILIVDDDPAVARLLRDLVEDEGHQTTVVTTGQAALAQPLLSFDLVLLDVNLPDLDGGTVCREIRRNTTIESLPVVMVSAHADSRHRVACLNVGADDYVAKPFDPDELIARISALLRVKRGEDALRRRNADLMALAQIVAIINRSQTLESLFADALPTVVDLLTVSAVAATLFEATEDPFSPYWGLPRELGELFNEPLHADFFERLAPTGEQPALLTVLPGENLAATALRRAGFTTLCCLPLGSGQDRLGFLWLLGREDVDLSGLDPAVLQALAEQFGIGIRNILLRQRLERKALEVTASYEQMCTYASDLATAFKTQWRQSRELSVIARLTAALVSTGTLRALTEVIAGGTAELADAEVAAVHILGLGNDGVAVVGEEHSVAHRLLLDAESPDGLPRLIIAQRRPVLIAELGADPACGPHLPPAVHDRSLICVPLVVRDKLLGHLFALAPAARGFQEDDLRSLALFGGQAGLAICTHLASEGPCPV